MSEQQDLWNLVEDFHFCMATTHEDGEMRSRPMSPRVDKDAGLIRFFSEAGAPLTTQIQANSEINLGFVAPKDRNFVSISGTAAVSQDRAMIKQLWDSAADAWFPGGPENANVALITVTPSQAELWDGTSSTIKTKWEMAKARRNDTKPDLTEHKKINL